MEKLQGREDKSLIVPDAGGGCKEKSSGYSLLVLSSKG